MGDLFHPDIPFEFIDKVLAVMVTNPRHTYLILTKREKRLSAFCKWKNEQIKQAGFDSVDGKYFYFPDFIWLGVSVENQEAAHKKLPTLIKIPAAVKYVSLEPMLEEIDVSIWFYSGYMEPPFDDVINLVILGGESGPKARPLHPDWVRKVRDDCQAANVPFYFKQWGQFIPAYQAGEKFMNIANYRKSYADRCVSSSYTFPDGMPMVKVGKYAAGHLLDGKEHLDLPGIK